MAGFSFTELRAQAFKDGAPSDLFRKSFANGNQPKAPQGGAARQDDAARQEAAPQDMPGAEGEPLQGQETGAGMPGPAEAPEPEQEGTPDAGPEPGGQEGSTGRMQAVKEQIQAAPEPAQDRKEKEPAGQGQEVPADAFPPDAALPWEDGKPDADFADFQDPAGIPAGEIIDVPPAPAKFPEGAGPAGIKKSGPQRDGEGAAPEAQYAKLSAAPSYRRPEPKIPTKAPGKTDTGDYRRSHLRDLPASLVDYVRSLFPSAENNNEAVGAYIFVKEGSPEEMDVPDRYKEVAKSYIGHSVSNESIQSSMDENITDLKRQIRLLSEKLDVVETGVAYNLFDRIGFRKKPNNDINAIDFMEPGMRDMVMRLETQAKNLHESIKERRGRRI